MNIPPRSVATRCRRPPRGNSEIKWKLEDHSGGWVARAARRLRWDVGDVIIHTGHTGEVLEKMWMLHLLEPDVTPNLSGIAG
ncbi:unnamed protein product [Arctogadus glacialis]